MSEAGQPKIKELTSLLRRLEQVKDTDPDLETRSNGQEAGSEADANAKEALAPPYANDDEAIDEPVPNALGTLRDCDDAAVASDELASLEQSQFVTPSTTAKTSHEGREIALRSEPQVPAQTYADLENEIATIAALGQSLALRTQRVEEKSTVSLGVVVLAVGASALVSMAATLFLAQRYLVPTYVTQPVEMSEAGLVAPRPTPVDPDVLNALPSAPNLPIAKPEGGVLDEPSADNSEALVASDAAPVGGAQTSDEATRQSMAMGGQEPAAAAATTETASPHSSEAREEAAADAAGIREPTAEPAGKSMDADEAAATSAPQAASQTTTPPEAAAVAETAPPGAVEAPEPQVQAAAEPETSPAQPVTPQAGPALNHSNDANSSGQSSEISGLDAKFPLFVPAYWVAPTGRGRPVPFLLASSSADDYRIIVAGLERDARIVGGTDITQGIWMIDGGKLSHARLVRGPMPPSSGQIVVELRKASGDLVGRRKVTLVTGGRAPPQ